MRGQWVECCHPDSPGVRVRVWRGWWRRKDRSFATLYEMRRCWMRVFPWEPWSPRRSVVNVIPTAEASKESKV